MIYWLQEATEAGAQGVASALPGGTLTGPIVVAGEEIVRYTRLLRTAPLGSPVNMPYVDTCLRYRASSEPLTISQNFGTCLSSVCSNCSKVCGGLDRSFSHCSIAVTMVSSSNSHWLQRKSSGCWTSMS